MSLRLVSLLVFLAACSTAPEKNNDECTDNSDCATAQECQEGACRDHLQCNLVTDGDCGPGQVLAEVNGEQGCYDKCVDGACSAGQTCASGICIGGAVDSGAGACSTLWDACSDDKTYRVGCVDGECTCTQNDVAGESFETTVGCTDTTFHREVNQSCGWLVPKFE